MQESIMSNTNTLEMICWCCYYYSGMNWGVCVLITHKACHADDIVWYIGCRIQKPVLIVITFIHTCLSSVIKLIKPTRSSMWWWHQGDFVFFKVCMCISQILDNVKMNVFSIVIKRYQHYIIMLMILSFSYRCTNAQVPWCYNICELISLLATNVLLN